MSEASGRKRMARHQFPQVRINGVLEFGNCELCKWNSGDSGIRVHWLFCLAELPFEILCVSAPLRFIIKIVSAIIIAYLMAYLRLRERATKKTCCQVFSTQLFQAFFGHGDQFAESPRIAYGQIGQNLAVHNHTGLFKAVDERAV